jgi:hypothetical protein
MQSFNRTHPKSALMNQLSNKAVEQKTLSAPLLMPARHKTTRGPLRRRQELLLEKVHDD